MRTSKYVYKDKQLLPSTTRMHYCIGSQGINPSLCWKFANAISQKETELRFTEGWNWIVETSNSLIQDLLQDCCCVHRYLPSPELVWQSTEAHETDSTHAMHHQGLSPLLAVDMSPYQRLAV